MLEQLPARLENFKLQRHPLLQPHLRALFQVRLPQTPPLEKLPRLQPQRPPFMLLLRETH